MVVSISSKHLQDIFSVILQKLALDIQANIGSALDGYGIEVLAVETI